MLLGNKMDMIEHREVTFKEAEKLAQVSSLPKLIDSAVVLLLMSSSTPHAGKQCDVLRGQRLHEQERDGVPDAPGQVRWRL